MKKQSKTLGIIIDLDGTLCNVDHRRHFVENRKDKDFKSFYAGIADDLPNEWCRQLVYSLNYRHEIIFVSGRPEEYREVTHEWLRQHIGHSYVAMQLHMRRDNDFRKDSIVKREIYQNHIEPYYHILFCVDDRKQVVDMWREVGLDCLHCAEGDF